jgi:hypothetical protein
VFLASKPILVVQNVPVVVRVKQVLVSTELVYRAQQDSIVKQTTNVLHRVVHAKLANSWVVSVPSVVWIVILAVLKIKLDPQRVKHVAKDNINVHPAMKLVWTVVSDNT